MTLILMYLVWESVFVWNTGAVLLLDWRHWERHETDNIWPPPDLLVLLMSLRNRKQLAYWPKYILHNFTLLTRSSSGYICTTKLSFFFPDSTFNEGQPLIWSLKTAWLLYWCFYALIKLLQGVLRNQEFLGNPEEV